MKIDDGQLKSYLIKNLQPLTEADPALLANYVAALLKNNKPKKELQKLCIGKLFDFLGDGTKQFVVKLFHALEDGSISEAAESSRHHEPGSGDVPAEPKISLSHRANGSDAEETSDDDDDDRNHKHRRRVSRSRSYDKDGEEDERGHHSKRSRSTENGQLNRESQRHAEYRRADRRGGREHGLASRIVVDGALRGGMRTGVPFRGDPAGSRFFGSGLQRGIGRGRGMGNGWLPPDQRFGAFSEGSDFPSALLPQGPSASNIFSGRVAGRGAPQSQWGSYGPIPGIVNGSLEHVIPLSAGRGNTAMGMNMVMPLAMPRCLDFEERGYCLRGDLCPMEHGANRIVVEDVQSLSKLTLPLANTRNGGPGSVSTPSTSLEMTGRGGRPNRDSGITAGADEINAGSTVSDLYDPDQPLWGKEHPETVRQVPQAYHPERQRQEWENASDIKDTGIEEASGKSGDAKGLESGLSVWDRIGPVDYRRVDGVSRLAGSISEGAQLRKQPRIEQGIHEQTGMEENTSLNNGVTQPERPQLQRAPEGTSYGGTGGRGDRGEKAQRTLYVRCIPTDCNKADSLRAHFQKFGEVLDVRIPPQSDRAFVQFARREDAEAALVSPEAVMGNRFIRLSWANRDNRLEPDLARLSKSNVQATVHVGRDAANGSSGDIKRPVLLNGSATQLQKRQEELEQMKEEIRKKQEALAQKRDEFKRKLGKLAKQGLAGQDTEKSSTGHDGNDPVPKPNAGEGSKVPISMVQSSLKASKSSLPRAGQPYNAPTWGPARYKLDNRTSVFRILTPLPTAPSDIAALKGHLAVFGEVSSVEVEEDSANDGNTIQVTFAMRRDAERAFTQGRVWQGQSLQFAWVNSAVATNSTASAAQVGSPNEGDIEADQALQPISHCC